jgi:hypothetical protein
LRVYFCLPLLLLCGQSFSQVKTLQAVKINQAPKIDGKLDDAAWTNAPVVSDFIQNYPTYGLPCSQRTDVKIFYDNTAIYIGAYLYDDSALIRKQITARDDEQQSNVDYFSVFFDTYNDHQNGFQFLVTTANVQSDARLGASLGDDLEYGDKSWDAVWESQVSMNADGWTVEMRVPYISLRFAKEDVQNWGLQFLRVIRRNNESSFWSPVDPQVNGFVNQFGDLSGLKNIQPPLRLSFSPYVSSGYRNTPVKNGFINEWLRNGGMDVKYGINESYTLDATLIPDFGQVVSDNVVNNLTPYEIKFEENRPFFTEGTEIFNKANLFYSRRIGSTPMGYDAVLNTANNDPNIEIIKNPTKTQLYNAIKFSGRTQNKLGIGIFNAVTAPMHAVIRDKTTGKDSTIETEALANYNIIVFDQAFKGQSYLTFTNTNVLRNGNGRDANVTALDIALYDKKNIHALQSTIRYSKIWGMNAYDGYNASLQYSKVSGKWRYGISGLIKSANYDPNDLGFLSSPNAVTYRLTGSHNQLTPTRSFITHTYTLDIKMVNLYKPYAYSRFDITGIGEWVLKNFWDLSLTSQIAPTDFHDYFELRTPGRYLNYPLNVYTEIAGGTDNRKKLYITYGGIFARSPKYNNNYYGTHLGFRYRFSNKLNFDLQTDSHYESNQLGYAFKREINGEPIVGFRDNRDFISVLSGIYNFTPRLNLTLRARHYWNKVNYINFHNVDAKGNLVPRTGPSLFSGSQDDNFNVFNLDAFLTWDFRLGSRIVLGYKNWLGNDEMVAISSRNSYLNNLDKIFDLRHGNEITFRFIYFLDYNQLRKKH